MRTTGAVDGGFPPPISDHRSRSASPGPGHLERAVSGTMPVVTDERDADGAADLAAYSVMRALLATRDPGRRPSDGLARADVARIVDDLEQRLGRDVVVELVGSLALRALRPVEQRAERAGTEPEAELAAEEQSALATTLGLHPRGED